MGDLNRLDPELKDTVEAGLPGVEKLLKLIESSETVDGKIESLKTELRRSDEEQIRKASILHGVTVKDVEVPGSDNLRIKLYRPHGSNDALPCLYHMHGGGLIAGSVDKVTAQMSYLSHALNAEIVSVDYRLSPENKYPAALDDCYDGLKWTFENADDLMIDKTKIGLFGESAGGGLAAATALLTRDREGPEILFQTLIAPMLDYRNITPSSHEFSAVWPSWPREMNELAWSAYLGDLESSAEIPEYASPSIAKDLSNLPPAYVEVGELELFRDEDINYAHEMMINGVDVEMHVYPGTFHGSYTAVPDAMISRKAVRNRLEWISDKFGQKLAVEL